MEPRLRGALWLYSRRGARKNQGRLAGHGGGGLLVRQTAGELACGGKLVRRTETKDQGRAVVDRGESDPTRSLGRPPPGDGKHARRHRPQALGKTSNVAARRVSAP